MTINAQLIYAPGGLIEYVQETATLTANGSPLYEPVIIDFVYYGDGNCGGCWYQMSDTLYTDSNGQAVVDFTCNNVCNYSFDAYNGYQGGYTTFEGDSNYGPSSACWGQDPVDNCNIYAPSH
jgi:hypothetical protein